MGQSAAEANRREGESLIDCFRRYDREQEQSETNYQRASEMCLTLSSSRTKTRTEEEIKQQRYREEEKKKKNDLERQQRQIAKQKQTESFIIEKLQDNIEKVKKLIEYEEENKEKYYDFYLERLERLCFQEIYDSILRCDYKTFQPVFTSEFLKFKEIVRIQKSNE